LPGVACHLTPEEDSYGNQESNQEGYEKEIQQQFPRQQREKGHARFRGKEIEPKKNRREEIIQP
jgi:hypothetical protein